MPGGGRQGRTSRLLALIIANFVAFWLPWNVLSLVVEFDSAAVPVQLLRLLDLGLKVLAQAGSACVNPILYVWSNDNIRGELMAGIRQRMTDNWRTTRIVRYRRNLRDLPSAMIKTSLLRIINGCQPISYRIELTSDRGCLAEDSLQE